MLYDSILVAIKNIRERKTRVFLTLLGIAIGIMAIISLMSIGEGMEEAVTKELSSLSDTIIATVGVDISASSMGGEFSVTQIQYFTDRDIGDISRIQGIRDIGPILAADGIVSYNGIIHTVSLMGLDSENMEAIFGLEALGLAQGSFLKQGDQNKCIIGHNVAEEYFDTEVPLGGRITINGKKFYVQGIYKEEGTGFSTQTDDTIHLTPKDFKEITGQSNVSALIIRVYDVNQVNTIADTIEQVVNENHGSDDFVNVITMTQILESIRSVLSIIQTVLLGIAAIALIVASIGIMNTMLTSVMERTHEIGIMKAIGAKNRDVMTIFILEGIFISLIGGIVGIILGFIGAKGFTQIASGPLGGVLVEPVFSGFSIILGVVVALFVGAISSFYPAWKAARMSPIEAVRYE